MKNLLLFFSFLFSLGISADDNFVDLGLPSGLLWATCNLGASAPEEVGNYYAWGETSPKAFFSEDNYKYKDSPIGLINISGTQYDAATAVLGGTWRMPTKEELEELANNCSRTQSTRNGIVCMELTGPNGNKLIIARGGLGEQGTTHEDGYGLWSSTKKASSTAYRAWEWNSISYSYTWQGIPVRPVTSQKPTDASNDIAINEENFPDENFRTFLKEQPYGEDDFLTEEEINSITMIDVSNKHIKSLEGIEFFTALVYLNCSGNLLTSLDVSKNAALTGLDCHSNQLTNLDVSKNKALTSLDCYANKLTSLDVSNNTALTNLTCRYNQLTSLDVSNNMALTELGCQGNQLTSLDVSKNMALTGLWCPDNQLTSLDVSKNTALTLLSCYSNQLKSLDVSKNTALTRLFCYNNQLTSLDVSKNTALTGLLCYNNQLTSLDVSKNMALTSLDCSDNKLTSLDMSNNTVLMYLTCRQNKLTSLDVSKDTALTYLNCYNNLLTSLDVSKNTNLQEVYCIKNQLTSLDVTKNTKLIHLHCYNNQLTRIDVSKENTALTDLSCYSNQINKEAMDSLINNLPQQEAAYLCVINQSYSSEGNVCTKTQVSSAKEKGWQVYAYNGDVDVEYEGSDPIENDIIINEENFPDEYFRDYLMKLPYGEDGIITAEEIKGITFIEIGLSFPIVNLKGLEYFTALQYLYLYDAQNLESLDVSQNTALVKLHCNGSKITKLDLSNNTALTEVYLYSNQITSLDVTKNTALTTLDCGGNQLTSLDVSKNTALEYLGCYGNQLTDLDVSKNTSLATLSCGNNQLTTLDVSMNTTLNYLHCGVNQLARLNVLNNKALTDLDCQNNLLSNLDVSKNTALTRLFCSGNQLTSLDVSKNAALTELSCYRNRINEEAMTSLIGSLPIQEHAFLYAIKLDDDTEGNVCTIEQVKAAKGKGWQVMVPYMWGFVEYENYERVIAINEKYFPDENFRNFLSQQNYGRDGWITKEEINIIDNINVKERNIASLKGIEHFTELTELDCSGNSLIDLDVSKNTALKTLICFNNQLTNLDVSKNTALTKLRCYENQIKGEAMDALVGSLPQQKGAELYVINLNDTSEGNICNTTQVNIAKEKGWIVKTAYGADYEGSDPAGIQDITFDKDIKTPIYDLNGRKLRDLSKGINIIEGKKVIVK